MTILNIILASLVLWIFSFIYVRIDDAVDEVNYFIRGLFQKSKVDTLKEFSRIRRNSPVREGYLYIFRFFYQISQAPNDIYSEIKYFIQRGLKGYSQRDIWEFNSYICKSNQEGLKEIRKCGNSCPLGVEYIEEWAVILDKIIYAWKLTEDISNGDRQCYVPRVAKKLQIEWKLLSKEEEKERQEGLQLYKQYFFNLWD